MAEKRRDCLFVFPLRPEDQGRLLPGVQGVFAYYHDRPLLGLVERSLGPEPKLEEATRAAVFEAIEARVEELGLEAWLYSEAGVGPKAKHIDVRGLVTGANIEAIAAACQSAGWVLIRPVDEAPKPLPSAAAARPEKRGAKRPASRAKRDEVPPPALPKPIAKQIKELEMLMGQAGVALPEGASFAEILALEAKLGVELPLEVRGWYLAHDGGREEEPTFGDRWLLSLDAIAGYWDLLSESYEEELDDDAEPDRGVRKKWWNKKWIPVTHDAGGNHHMLDLAPTKSGKLGQIISYYHDDGGRSLEGPGFLTWLATQMKESAAA